MADKNEKSTREYSAQEIVAMLSKMAGAITGGDMSGTVLGAPESPENYDVVSANAEAMKNMYVNNFATEMIAAARFKRVRAVAAATGTGMMGVTAIDKLMQFNPNIAEAILGQHGAKEATQSLLAGANGFANALGMASGGVLDPHRMTINSKWAASLGAVAMNNNFDKHGRVDAKFTHGLGLQQSAALSGRIMSDRSIYDDWRERQLERTEEWNSKNFGASSEQRRKAGIMTESEIKAFSNGFALSPAAVKSFQDHMKKFQEGINGLVSSVSKITGGFESAVDFLQDMTNGKLYSAGKSADAARRRASVAAANLRVLAADAGEKPSTMYNMIRGGAEYFNHGNGRTDPYDQAFMSTDTAANVGALHAGAILQYKKDHPNATEQDIEKFKLGMAARSAGFGGGDAVKHNVFLADAVKTGRISKEEAKRLAASGNQELVYRRLRKLYGPNLDMLAKNKIFMENLRRGNEDFINELDTISYNEGTRNEGEMYDQRGAFNYAKTYTDAITTGMFGKSRMKEIAEAERDAFISTGVLKRSGLSDADIKKVQETAKKKNWSASEVKKHLTENLDVDERTLNREAIGEFKRNIDEMLHGTSGLERDTLLSGDTLKDAGLTAEQIKSVREEARKNNWNVKDIRKHLVEKMKVDEAALDRASTKKILSARAADETQLQALYNMEMGPGKGMLRSLGLDDAQIKKVQDDYYKNKWGANELRSHLVKDYGVSEKDIERELNRRVVRHNRGESMDKFMRKEAMLSNRTLEALGLDKKKIREVQTLAKKNGWSAEEVERHLVNKVKVDKKNLETETVNTAFDMRSGINNISEQLDKADKDINPEVTNEHLKRARVTRKVDAAEEKLKDLRTEYKSAMLYGDDKKLSEVYEKITKAQDDAASGSGTYMISDSNVTKALFEKAINSGRLNKFNDKQKKDILENMMKQFQAGINTGNMSYDDAVQAANDYVKKNYGADLSDLTGSKQRQKTVRDERLKSGAMAIANAVFNKFGLSDDDKAFAQKQLAEKLRDGELIKKAEREVNSNPELKKLKGRDRELAIAKIVAKKATVGKDDAIGIARGPANQNKLKAEEVDRYINSRKGGEEAFNQKVQADLSAIRADDGNISKNTPMDKTEYTKEEYDIARDIARGRNGGSHYTNSRARGVSTTDQATDKATSALGNIKNAKFVEASDVLEAQSRVEALGGGMQFDKDEIENLLKVDEKKAELLRLYRGEKADSKKGTSRVKSLTEQINDDSSVSAVKRERFGTDGPITSKHLSDFFKTMLEQHGDMSDEAFSKHLKESGVLNQLGIEDRILDARDSKGNLISAKRVMASYIAAAKAESEGEKANGVEQALVDGYTAQSIKDGDKSIASDDAVNWLRMISISVSKIAGNNN